MLLLSCLWNAMLVWVVLGDNSGKRIGLQGTTAPREDPQGSTAWKRVDTMLAAVLKRVHIHRISIALEERINRYVFLWGRFYGLHNLACSAMLLSVERKNNDCCREKNKLKQKWMSIEWVLWELRVNGNSCFLLSHSVLRQWPRKWFLNVALEGETRMVF